MTDPVESTAGARGASSPRDAAGLGIGPGSRDGDRPRDAFDPRDDGRWDEFVASTTLGSYLQSSAWARVKAVNGWESTRVLTAESGAGTAGSEVSGVPRIGAQILLRRPGPIPWSFAYAPRGPFAEAWDGDAIARFTDALRSSGAIRAARVSHLRIDPEVELDGPSDADGALR